MATLLLTRRAMLDAKDADGATPLLHAVRAGPSAQGLVEILLSAKANPLIKDAHGTSALILAMQKKPGQGAVEAATLLQACVCSDQNGCFWKCQ